MKMIIPKAVTVWVKNLVLTFILTDTEREVHDQLHILFAYQKVIFSNEDIGAQLMRLNILL